VHPLAEFQTVALGKAIEKNDPDRQTQLLTGNSVYETFKNGSKTRRLQPAKPFNQLLQPGMS